MAIDISHSLDTQAFLGSLVLSPECIEGPVLSLSKDRRVASLYQEKEVKKRSKINEENTLRDPIRELSGFFSNDM